MFIVPTRGGFLARRFKFTGSFKVPPSPIPLSPKEQAEYKDSIKTFYDEKSAYTEKEPLKPYENNVNPETGEVNGPKGIEPTRYGDWERKGKVTDF